MTSRLDGQHTIDVPQYSKVVFSYTCFQFAEHALLSIKRCALVKQQSLGQVAFVESLKDVLALNISEQNQDTVQGRFQLLIRQVLVQESHR